MDVLKKCAQRIINAGFSGSTNGLILCDGYHGALAKAIEGVFHDKNRNQEIMIVNNKMASDKAFRRCLSKGWATIVLLEPRSYFDFQVYRWLDFSLGMPKVAGIYRSLVSILPLKSTIRLYGSDPSRDAAAKAELLSLLRPNSKYKIVADGGTELYFTARHWLDQDNELLTAPLEKSINGVIAVDGAFFYRKITTIVDFFIEEGKLTEIKARNKQDDDLVWQYRHMTAKDFAKPKNRQLAEVGIGTNTGAVISDCFMEAETVYGTCHFCFGNNDCYGGNNKSDFHGGSVLIKEPRFLPC